MLDPTYRPWQWMGPPIECQMKCCQGPHGQSLALQMYVRRVKAGLLQCPVLYLLCVLYVLCVLLLL